jgi:WD40 repeat protein
LLPCFLAVIQFLHFSGSKDANIKLWDLSAEACRLTFEGHKKDVSCLAVTSDNKLFVSGSTDFTLKIWSAENPESIHTIRDYNDSITDVVMTTDNRFFIAGSHESKKQLRMWDIKSGEYVMSFDGHNHAVMHLQLLRAHDILVSSSRDGTVKIWDINTGAMMSSFDFQSQVKYYDCALDKEDHYSLIAVTKSGTVGVVTLWNPQPHANVVTLPKSDPGKSKALEKEDEEINEFQELRNDPGNYIKFNGNSSSCGKYCCRCCKCVMQ